MTRELLDFDDAGAEDDHPAKGVTVGDIRGWFDEIEQLHAALQEARIVMREWAEIREEVAAEIERLTGEVKALHETIGEIDRQHTAEVERLKAFFITRIAALEPKP